MNDKKRAKLMERHFLPGYQALKFSLYESAYSAVRHTHTQPNLFFQHPRHAPLFPPLNLPFPFAPNPPTSTPQKIKSPHIQQYDTHIISSSSTQGTLLHLRLETYPPTSTPHHRKSMSDTSHVRPVGTYGPVGASTTIYSQKWVCTDCKYTNFAAAASCKRCKKGAMQRSPSERRASEG